MRFPRDAVPLLRCPITGSPLVLDDQPSSLRRAPRGAEALLRSEQGSHAYPIVDGIAHLLPSDALSTEDDLRQEKEVVQSFYDDFGWQQEGGVYRDSALFGDLRPFYMDYEQRGLRRTMQTLARAGEVFLDAASGPVQHQVTIEESSGFARYICLDLSLTALRQAGERVGPRAVCVRGDITNLPIAPGVVDACLSLHTIYHIPSDEQPLAVRQLHQALAPGGRLGIVYSRPSLRLLRALSLPSRALRRLRRRFLAEEPAARPPLYAHFHQPEELCTWVDGSPGEITAHLLVGPEFSRSSLKAGRGGRSFLRACSRIEAGAPSYAGRLCQFPLISFRR